MIRSSDSIAKLSAALVKAQAEVQNAVKDSTNPHFGSTFASLISVLDAVKPVFAKHGIAIVQLPGMEDGHATVDTMLLHESGEWITGTSGAPLQKNDPQGVGSAITYLRRYSLAALAGIGQEDDDGNAASHRQENGSARSQPSAPPPDDMIDCPKCGGPCWDNRKGKKNPKGPDLKCRDKSCDHAIWLGTWKDELLKDLAGAHAAGAIDAAERDKGEQAAESKNPGRMLALGKWLDAKIQAGILGG
jgi:hypothetical protein